MSSIGSTLNSINTSLLNEISSITSTQRTSGSASTTSTSSTNSSDTLDFSKVAELFKELDDLKSSDPTKLKQVLSDAASKLTDAAGKATDSNQSKLSHGSVRQVPEGRGHRRPLRAEALVLLRPFLRTGRQSNQHVD